MTLNAFIFARGGSKGLPRKNIKLLGGKPLIQYSIETAKAVPAIKNIFVSTDDSEISEIASRCGAIVIERPLELSGDKSPEWDAWQHAIEWVTLRYGDFDGFVSLPATSPFRSVEDVELAIKKRVESNADICVSMTPASRNPSFNMLKASVDGLFELVNKPQGTIYRRQDAPAVFDMTTVVYVTTTNFVMSNNGIFDGRLTSIEVPKERAIDIDDIYDFKLAEAILNMDDTE